MRDLCRYFYLITMAGAFLIAFISIVQFPLLGGGIVAFHIDALPITFHSLFNCVSFIALTVVWVVSRNNYLQRTSTRHVTTIEKR